MLSGQYDVMALTHGGKAARVFVIPQNIEGQESAVSGGSTMRPSASRITYFELHHFPRTQCSSHNPLSPASEHILQLNKFL